MKKLLYLFPLVFLILNATPLALYKNSVNYSPNGRIYQLTPSYWRQLSTKVAKTNQSVYESTIITGNAGTPPSAVPISKGARFYGFPMGFYFNNSNVKNNSLPNIPTTVTAYSWLWATLDSFILIIFLVAAIWINIRPSSQLKK